ncbi:MULTISPECIES: HlyD family secretion protein [Brucella]|uniref:Secretion protein HlyD family protein n=1 Tax=Brucella anthropi (strain ATCC 49188 / DSM 6882 / CCUG 24695 / JCM 21032 / LMG 3331 / NBRC 15819 / NCTC 12168 / Alc 37) TaxID=439375 RepID=A6X6E6_BRUA4|nr:MULTISPECIES: biotin/lipoyl-binding protein [Brucella]ABS16800.1 secretion protein HlyD family protein [Brucella anthropi ATCC 49188]AIK42648.1 hlyD secretion family protein [Brucella anthropi]KAB2732651.1 HlyD family secretion protein [Brucella anthropi]KAB2747781.1 HlyD family secretion protein [Brucella anthropi]KAB2753986.1 HlyD family secretion protein [Brucella anthropi]
MFEFLLCSMITILPDYLYRRFGQGKRIGHEITIYSMWFELRWGITACLILTISLITMIFYYHPSTSNVTAAFRTVTILPEIGGRVDEVYVSRNQKVKAGEALFKLDDSKQKAALETARKRIAEIDAEMVVAKSDLVAADARIKQGEIAFVQAQNDVNTQLELQRRNPNIVARKDIERLQSIADGKGSELAAATASKQTLETKITSLLPAQRASTEAAAAQAEVELNKTIVKAGVSGTVQQFTLRAGEVVNPLLRPAGILVPETAGRTALIAGFGQIEAQVMKPGMIAEATCIGKPFMIIPMVVTEVQDVIAGGQVRASDQLVDIQQLAKPGTITVTLEPLYEGQLAGIPPGSSCVANAYTSNHEELQSGEAGTLRSIFLHAVDATALVHAMILRIQAVMMPVQTLVLSGH